MSPSVSAVPPMDTMKAGRMAVAISCPKSEKKLVQPIARTFRFSQWFLGVSIVVIESMVRHDLLRRQKSLAAEGI
jgi:hypothetical protein